MQIEVSAFIYSTICLVLYICPLVHGDIFTSIEQGNMWGTLSEISQFPYKVDMENVRLLEPFIKV